MAKTRQDTDLLTSGVNAFIEGFAVLFSPLGKAAGAVLTGAENIIELGLSVPGRVEEKVKRDRIAALNPKKVKALDDWLDKPDAPPPYEPFHKTIEETPEQGSPGTTQTGVSKQRAPTVGINQKLGR